MDTVNIDTHFLAFLGGGLVTVLLLIAAHFLGLAKHEANSKR